MNTWALAWVAHVLPRAPLDLFEAPIFYPEVHTLAYSEHLVVPALMGAPLLWLGASPVLVHNLLIILGLTLSAWAMYLVAARWTGSGSAGIVAALLYAFNAHVFTRFAHLQAQHVEFFPIMIYALDRVLERGRRRDMALLCGAFILQSLCSNYLLVFSAAAMIAAVAVRPNEWLITSRRAPAIRLLIAGGISVAALAPFLWPYYLVSRDQGFVRGLDEVALHAAGWQDYLATGGRLHYAWWSHAFFEGRTALFPGVTASVLALIALGTGVAWRDRRARMMLAIGVVGVLLSLGPSLPGYAWLHTHVPLLSGLRNAGRWGWLFLAAVAVLAGYGAAIVEASLQTRLGTARPAVEAGLQTRLTPILLPALLCLLVTAEAIRTPVPYTPFNGISRIYDVLAAEPGAIVAEFPFFSGGRVNLNGPYLVNATRHWRPLVNGYSGFRPRTFEERGERLQRFPEASAVEELRRLGVTHVTVHTAAFESRSGVQALRAVESLDDLALVADLDGIRLYRLR